MMGSPQLPWVKADGIPGGDWRMLPLLAAVIGLCGGPSHAQAAQAPPESSFASGTVERVQASVFEEIFNDQYARLNGRDAPTALNGMGITCRYAFAELMTSDDRRWQSVGGHFMERSPTERIRHLPTLDNARELMALAGLDMTEIMRFQELNKDGDRPALIAILAKYIDPKMDKYNRAALEGYDPALCLNATRDHVFRIDISEQTLDQIRGRVKLFHAGRHAEYRDRLEDYLRAYPNLSYLHVEIGNAYFAEGDLVAAEQWYDKGASVNPLNPMLAYSRAFCHLARGDAAAAVESLTESVMTCRNNFLAWLALDCLLSARGGRICDHRFQNRTDIIVDTATIIVDKRQTQNVLEPWLYYAAAELATKHPRCRTWCGFDSWDLEAIEYYKIAHLLGMYLASKSKDESVFDPYLEDLSSIFEAGYLRQYVLFDKIAPYSQYFRVATLPEAERAQMRRYVDRFVIVQPDQRASPIPAQPN